MTENGYHEERLYSIPATGLHPYVTSRREEKDDGLKQKKEQLPAVFTYNLVVLRAAKLIYCAREHSIEGIGDVAWKDGEQTWKGSRIKVLLDSPSPKTVLKE